MTLTAAGPGTVRRRPDGRLVAECPGCGVHLEQLPGTPVGEALRSFRECHPLSASAPHVRRLPTGWRTPLSGPGVLSQ